MTPPPVTGTVLIRDTNARPAGRRVVLVLGAVAVPDDFPACPDGRLFPAAGLAGPDLLRLDVLGPGADLPERWMRAATPDQLVTAKIWRV